MGVVVKFPSLHCLHWDQMINLSKGKDKDMNMYGSINTDTDVEWEHVDTGATNQYFNIFDTEREFSHTDPEAEFENRKKTHEAKKLGQFRATAIAGNDITSSCLYVVGIAVVTSGKLAPFSLLLVAILLYLFRAVYSEVVTALPLNGGAYNALLNTTTKSVAALAAVLTVLSYVATAVVSASEACAYINNVWSEIPVFWTTFGVLGFFAFLNLIGITESSVVALAIFSFHLLTLFVLAIASSVYMFENLDVIQSNWHNYASPNGNYFLDVYYGFSAALLGVSGFESSANYIEEQKEGVFPKTLRNMWAIVAILNPLMGLLVLGVVPYTEYVDQESFILATMGGIAFGDGLNIWVSIDAFLVLSGAVLTSYVGVTGLIRRMALDRCLPQFFLQENPLTHTNHWIILGFFGVTASLYAIVLGNVNTLSGMYSVAFLGVMSLFAVGCMMLKYKRNDIPRKIRAHWWEVILGFIGVIAGLLGNILLDIDILAYFTIYFSITFLLVMLMFSRVFMLKLFLYFLRKTPLYSVVGAKVKAYALSFKELKIIFFAKTDDPAVLNKAILYVRDNEQSMNVHIVHVYNPEVGPPPKLAEYVTLLDQVYPKMTVSLDLVQGKFSPAMVQRISEKMGVPPNFMFIACPDEKMGSIADFGGVRLITH